MAKPIKILWSPILYIIFLFPVLVIVHALSGAEPMPNSSRECAICHIRWVETLVRNKTQENVMEDVLERQAGSGNMCLSCHDGSVVDSRFKVWSTRHHTTDSVPSPAVNIPIDKFPLDEQGRMTCSTCHTAHAVPDSSDLKTVIFLRQPNIDSSLCLSCHPQHAQKNDFQHPLGEIDYPIPQEILDAGGKTSVGEHTIICQTCHEPHGARNNWMLVLPPAKLCITCHTNKAPETKPVAGAPVHLIGHTYPGFEPPATLLDEEATFGANGELDCLSCHRLHDASGAKPLLIRKNESSSLCLECHKKEGTVIESRHDLRFSSPDSENARGEKPSVSGPCGSCHRVHGWARDVPETNRPHSSGCMECHEEGGPGSHNRLYVDAHTVGTPLSESMSTTLPLDSATGNIGCLTCHDPHNPRSSEIETEGGLVMRSKGEQNDSNSYTEPDSLQETVYQVPAPLSFLRYDGSQLCVHCHNKTGFSLQTPHDPAEFSHEARQKLGLHPSVGPCRVCHTTHNAQGPHLWTHKPLAQSDSDISNLCGSCHEDKVGLQNSVHNPETSEWSKEIGFTSHGSCIDCHPVHGQMEKNSIWSFLGSEEKQSHRCETCHRKEGPGKEMVNIHEGKILVNIPKNLPTNLKVNHDGQILCTTCHDIHQKDDGSKMLKIPMPDLCVACHEDKVGIESSVHDPSKGEWAMKLGFDSKGLCIDCHPVHSPRGKGGIWDFVKNNDNSEQLCDVCHHTGEPGKEVETPHVGKILSDNLIPSFENLIGKNNGRILCTTCHEIHQKRQDHMLLRMSRQDSSLCLACHSEADSILDTPHDLRTSSPEEHNIRGEIADESGPCGSCHLIHRTPDGVGLWAPGSIGKRAFGNEFCTCCHKQGLCAEASVPKYMDHPEVAFLNRTHPQQPGYMPTFNSRGQQSKFGTISCLTCHDPHATPSNSETNNNSSLSYRHLFLRSTRNQSLCVDCHGKESLWRFLYYHKEHRHP